MTARRTPTIIGGLDDSGVPQIFKVNASGQLELASPAGVTGVIDGRKTVTTAGTREALVAVSTPCKRVTITALTGNLGTVAVGGSTVVAALATLRGTPLAARDAYELEIDNLNKVFLDSTISGEGVSFTAST